MADEKKSLQDQLRDMAVDVRNEAIMQSANLYLIARRVLLTSLGAVAMTIEEGNDFIDKLVDRGEVAEADLARLVYDFVERSNEREVQHASERRATSDKAAAALADSVEVILGRLNVPTRSDIDELSRKISTLNEKVITYRQRSGGAALGGSLMALAPELDETVPPPTLPKSNGAG